uniref:Uncharacterized protein n=1 Tax=Glossina austeni TaxID=7395 RepID=A0A1A9VQH8_GLOAU
MAILEETFSIAVLTCAYGFLETTSISSFTLTSLICLFTSLIANFLVLSGNLTLVFSPKFYDSVDKKIKDIGIKLEEKFNSRINDLQVVMKVIKERCTDIIISDLLAQFVNILAHVVKVTNCLNNDVLVKFNSIVVRKVLWRNYLTTSKVILTDIISGEIRTRIYINEHLPPLCRKLNSLYSQMKKNGKITKLKIFKKDLPKVSVTPNDHAVVLYDIYTFLNRTHTSMMLELNLEPIASNKLFRNYHKYSDPSLSTFELPVY